MVRPGKTFAEDAWDILKKVQWPNPDHGNGKAAQKPTTVSS
jgi:hypothetical protein